MTHFLMKLLDYLQTAINMPSGQEKLILSRGPEKVMLLLELSMMEVCLRAMQIFQGKLQQQVVR